MVHSKQGQKGGRENLWFKHFSSASGNPIQLLACHQGEVGLVLQISDRNIIIPPLPLNGITQFRTIFQNSNIYALAGVGISCAVGMRIIR